MVEITSSPANGGSRLFRVSRLLSPLCVSIWLATRCGMPWIPRCVIESEERGMMGVLIINQFEVPQLLPMDECIGVMEQALATLARGDAILPLRPTLWLPEHGSLCLMP